MANTTPSNYRCVVFLKDKLHHPLIYAYVKSIYYLHNTMIKQGIDYHYINIYHRKSGLYLGRQYFDKFIVDKPPF